MSVSVELAGDPGALLAARQAERARILDDQLERARTVALELGRTYTCQFGTHATCIGLAAGGRLGCLCECHDATVERERLVHENPELAVQIRRGIDEAERGETVDRGSFAQYLEDGDDDG